MPAYMHMSDHVRLCKPPQFQHWQSTFSYFQVTGSAVFAEASDDHIHRLPAPETDHGGAANGPENGLESLVVTGRSCGTMPDEENVSSEEIILA